jgi:DNA replication and repair protein RecF
VRRLRVTELSVRCFRNLEALDLTFGDGLHVFAGPNGAGKSSLLEALYALCTSRSFRTSRAAEVVAHASEAAHVRATLVETGGALADLTRRQRIALAPGQTRVHLDEARPRTLAEYARASPVVVFHPGELTLTMGPASMRRTLLDRVAFHLAPASFDARARYVAAIRSRQRILESRGPSADAELVPFEAIAAQHGAELARWRADAAELLCLHLARLVPELLAPGLDVTCALLPGGPSDAGALSLELARHRQRDAHRPSPTVGPHRDELDVRLGGHPARLVASQGQHRALTIALKAAESAAVAESRSVLPVWLLDDVSSELDAERSAALFALLARVEAQVFLTTTRPELIALHPSMTRRDYRLREGAVTDETAAMGVAVET